MGSLVLQDVPSSVLTRLERRAQELGITPAEEAIRLLRALLVHDDQGDATDDRREGAEHLEERGGYLVFTGELDTGEIEQYSCTIGVRGCGKQATYVHLPNADWVMNNTATPATPPK